jgi:hypothetical protein
MLLSNFVELKPTRQRLSLPGLHLARQQIKVSFQRLRYDENTLKTAYAMVMYIGMGLCQPLQLQARDKIKFFLEENDDRIWQIKKAWDDQGYTLFNPHQNKAVSRYLKFQMVWRFFDPTPSYLRLQRVSHELCEEGLLIRLTSFDFLPKMALEPAEQVNFNLKQVTCNFVDFTKSRFYSAFLPIFYGVDMTFLKPISRENCIDS